MTIEKWRLLVHCALGGESETAPVALIVDSPWIPGHVGVSTFDYVTLPDVWLEANLAIEREFSDVIFLPGFWAEVGMAAEPSGFGCKIRFYRDSPPSVIPLLTSTRDAQGLEVPNPRHDGLMPLVLNFYRRMKDRINAEGHVVKMVAARGPLTVAAHLVGVTAFLEGIKLDGVATHRLLRTTTSLIKDWLHAQAEVVGDVEGVLVLDDISGMMGPRDYEEFAHPYLKDVFESFPGTIKMFHNDTDNPLVYRYMSGLGINLFNFTHLQPLWRVRELVGDSICLVGNVPPLDVLARGSTEDVIRCARTCLDQRACRKGLVLSAGGGVSPGTPAANIRALVDAARD
ncbi:MAG: uroporphyrinogen decarboxylase family protein, partial [Verrucomicrobiae bacterium]|nr:uroporphyrinogen decarboxylase family protein [Verrucomicrobiae bacterium]